MGTFRAAELFGKSNYYWTTRGHKPEYHNMNMTLKDQSSNSFFNPLNTKRRLLYLKTQFVPRSKHFSSRL